MNENIISDQGNTPDGQPAGSESGYTITLVGPLPGGSRAIGRRDIVERSVDVDHLQKNFQRFLQGLQAMLAVDIPSVGDFELDEVQFSAEISADGAFKLMGTGVSVEASSGVTFTLRRNSQIKKE